jgi:guanine deaminase
VDAHSRWGRSESLGRDLHPEFMRRAIREARRNLRTPQGGPFGACIVRQGEILAVSHNTVLGRNDATCHAEVNAIRVASRKLGRFDLSGCEIYSTTEPCPMCFSAIHWARISRLVYGTCIADVQALGFNELAVPNALMKRKSHSPVMIIAGFLLEECTALLRDWDALPVKPVY